jgi:transcriptional regulator
MYVPKNMVMPEEVIAGFIAEYGFGLLLSSDLQATRLPLLYQPNEDTSNPTKGRLIGHMAKANPQWRSLDGQRVSVMFNGPHAYVSPTWYAAPPAVPTWNYASVQCFGRFTLLDDTQTSEAINQLVKHYEPEFLGNTELMPDDYQAKLMKAVVGFHIDVDEIHAKEKLSQHKSMADQQGVLTGLQNADHPEASQLVSYMKKRHLGTGTD